MSQHIVASFDADLKSLDDMVMTMARSVIRQHEDASDLIASRDASLAGRIIEGDRAIVNPGSVGQPRDGDAINNGAINDVHFPSTQHLDNATRHRPA